MYTAIIRQTLIYGFENWTPPPHASEKRAEEQFEGPIHDSRTGVWRIKWSLTVV